MTGTANICPNCHSSLARELDMTNLGTLLVRYYRCEVCGHAWNVPKGGPRTPRNVTRSRKVPEERSED